MAEAHNPDKYYVPHGSKWPVIGSVAFLFMMTGVSAWLNGSDIGQYVMFGGVAIMLYMLFGWFGTVIDESESGIYNNQVDKSFRTGMSWFIFSEVMFFAAFFGALFYARSFVLPWLDGQSNNFFTNLLLWSGFESSWPSNGPANVGGDYQVMGPLGLPLINTIILLSSSVTITIAHHAIAEGKRNIVLAFLGITVALGFIFVALQAEEYIHAYQEMNLTLETGIYGSTFFMLTGFHGLHVTLGAIILLVVWIRVLRGHFTPTGHFAFEAGAWYWHFVDVVWLGLYIFVYWL
ncbi:MAG: cytochrome c oxidase subunit 3 [Pseudomonadota bacterium]